MRLGMGRRAIHDERLHAHFITFSCCGRRRLLDDDRAKRVVLGVLNWQLAGRKASCAGFAVMPERVHAILWFPTAGQLSVFPDSKAIGATRGNAYKTSVSVTIWAELQVK